jgi:hypothetical protein
MATVVALSACVPDEPAPTPSPSASSSVPTTAPTSSPTPVGSPTPTPDPQALVLSSTGLGPLLIGMPAAESTLIAPTTTNCGVEGGEEFTDWRTTLPSSSNNAQEIEKEVFRVGVDDEGIVYGISVRDASITTPWGVGIGSTLDDVLAIPGVVEGPSAAVWHRLIVPGSPGTVIFDIGDNPDPTYWGDWQGKVTYIQVLADDRVVPPPNMHGPFPGACL